MNDRIKKKRRYSFQLQMIAYSLASMALAALTIFLLALAVYGILAMMRNETGDAGYGSSGYQSYSNYQAHSNYGEAAGDAETKKTVVTGAEFKSGLPGEKMLHKGSMFALMVLAVLLALFFFILYFLLLTRKFGAYLGEISAGIRGLAAGQLGTRIAVRQSNELTQIAENFNAMAEELERAAAEERSNEGAKNNLITSIAHDLRTPLTSVIGYLELVAEKNLDEETRAHYVSVAYRKAKRLQCLTDDLFSYIKYGSAELTLNLSPIDAVKMMEQLVEEAYPGIAENNLELSVEKKLREAIVRADGTLLARAFSNLLGNAIKYGRDGKSLRILMEPGEETRTVRFHIVNFGEVIPAKDIEHIFERFYRVDAARTEEQGGTGLGLAIAKNIIELHKGTISVKSDLSGTEFLVELPVTEWQ